MENICQDIRVLSLYKQHYFDHYDFHMDDHYSCLGYYDGIGIKRIPQKDSDGDFYASHLFEKKSQACLSRVWSGTVYETAGLHGKHSEQIIGIFRCEESVSEYKLIKGRDAERNSPYFTLVFLQAQKHTDYKSIENEIEQLCVYEDDLSNPYIHLSVYHTYDNADLVVLMYSNSIHKIGETLEEIRKKNKICYVHSIIGMSEAFLSDCKFEGKLHVLSEWRGRKSFIDDKLPHVTMKIATSGTANVPEKIVYQLRNLLENCNIDFTGDETIEFSEGTGHGHLRMDINGTDVKSLITLLADDGLLNHTNQLFGQSIYNIETSLYWHSRNISELKESDIEAAGREDAERREKDKDVHKDEYGNSGCYFETLTKRYGEKMKIAWGNKDEGLFSYYSALAQVYNTLAQYEGFSLSRDIFSLLYPSVQMFEALLERASLKQEKTFSFDVEESRKDSICEFVNAVNSVVYHTIHTDQIFLMVPGYSGNTYSIPIKLCLLYSWIIKKVITVLNDVDYKYACLLTPELETRPATTLINMGMFEDDRLIRFSSSQRSLYMPRHFIILITHEIGHYTGKNIRNRHLRLECISRILVQLMFEGVFPEKYCAPENVNNLTVRQRLYLKIRESVKVQTEYECLCMISKKFEKSNDERKEHATELSKIFKEVCYELLEEQGVIHNCIGMIPDGFEREFGDADMDDVIGLYIDIQNQLDRNRRILFSSHDIMDTCINELIQIFREVFSDVAALAILGYDYQTFSEVFNVSEGTIANSDRDVQRKVRELVIRKIMDTSRGEEQKSNDHFGSSSDRDHDHKIQNAGEDQGEIRPWPISLKDEFYTYCWTGEELMKYADESYKALLVQAERHSVDQEQIRDIYKMFTTDETSCSDIYEKIIDVIEEYNNEIQISKRKDEEMK